MNILIVDDNDTNRMLLRALFEQYMQDNVGAEFDIEEANDGLIAVQKCREGLFDIVLMDIMMPNMDGVEATRIIREENKTVMIIAISAVDDEKKKLILDNGAEDYISKPIDMDIFINRLGKYITLVQARKHKKKSHYGINLYESQIFFRHTKFMLASEDSLSEFWEFFLLNARQKCDNLSDIVRVVFSIAEIQIKKDNESPVYIEESEEYQYFTLTNIHDMSCNAIKSIIDKNNSFLEYKMTNETVSFMLKKNFSTPNVQSAAQENSSSEGKILELEKVEKESSSSLEYAKSTGLIVFDYLEEEDLDDLEHYAGRLKSLMLMVGIEDTSEEEIIEIYSNLEKIGAILSPYSEVHVISKALTQLSIDLSTHTKEFEDNSEALTPVCKAFSNDISNWIQKSFYTGAPSADFMNDTIAVNCQTISSMLMMDEQSAESEMFDDIFDF